MFDNKLYYQLNKTKIREYQKNYFYSNIDKWKEYHLKYKNQKEDLNYNINIMKKVFILWKKYKNPCCLKVIKGPFII